MMRRERTIVLLILFALYCVYALVKKWRDASALKRERKKLHASQSDEVFLHYTFTLFAKLASSDKRVLPEEIAFLDRYMQHYLNLDAEKRKKGVEAFKAGKNSAESFERIAHKISTLFPNDTALLENLLETLLCLALADGEITAEEEQLVKSAAAIFKLDLQYDQMRRRIKYYFEAKDNARKTDEGEPQSSDGLSPYQALGLPPNASLAQVKKQYRKLAMMYHPDRLVARGLPKEMAANATRRFQSIQRAYEEICKLGAARA